MMITTKLQTNQNEIASSVAISINMEQEKSVQDCVQEINQWINSILSRESLDQAFENAIDKLAERPDIFVLGDLYLKDITPALNVLGIWLMNGIDQAKTHLNTTMSETKRFESAIDLCKQGFYQTKIATALYITTKEPLDETSTESIEALYALYALVDEFYDVERELINNILSEEDIKNCPHIPEEKHETILALLLSTAFENIAVEDKQYLLNGIEHLSECLGDSLFLLASISNQIINFI